MTYETEIHNRLHIQSPSVENTIRKQMQERPVGSICGALFTMTLFVLFWYLKITEMKSFFYDGDTLKYNFASPSILSEWYFIFVLFVLWAGFVSILMLFPLYICARLDTPVREARLTHYFCLQALKLVELNTNVRAFRDAIISSGRDIRYADYDLMTRIVLADSQANLSQEQINACEKLHTIA